MKILVYYLTIISVVSAKFGDRINPRGTQTNSIDDQSEPKRYSTKYNSEDLINTNNTNKFTTFVVAPKIDGTNTPRTETYDSSIRRHTTETSYYDQEESSEIINLGNRYVPANTHNRNFRYKNKEKFTRQEVLEPKTNRETLGSRKTSYRKFNVKSENIQSNKSKISSAMERRTRLQNHLAGKRRKLKLRNRFKKIHVTTAKTISKTETDIDEHKFPEPTVPFRRFTTDRNLIESNTRPTEPILSNDFNFPFKTESNKKSSATIIHLKPASHVKSTVYEFGPKYSAIEHEEVLYDQNRLSDKSNNYYKKRMDDTPKEIEYYNRPTSDFSGRRCDGQNQYSCESMSNSLPNHILDSTRDIIKKAQHKPTPAVRPRRQFRDRRPPKTRASASSFFNKPFGRRPSAPRRNQRPRQRKPSSNEKLYGNTNTFQPEQLLITTPKSYSRNINSLHSSLNNLKKNTKNRDNPHSNKPLVTDKLSSEIHNSLKYREQASKEKENFYIVTPLPNILKEAALSLPELHQSGLRDDLFNSYQNIASNPIMNENEQSFYEVPNNFVSIKPEKISFKRETRPLTSYLSETPTIPNNFVVPRKYVETHRNIKETFPYRTHFKAVVLLDQKETSYSRENPPNKYKMEDLSTQPIDSYENNILNKPQKRSPVFMPLKIKDSSPPTSHFSVHKSIPTFSKSAKHPRRNVFPSPWPPRSNLINEHEQYGRPFHPYGFAQESRKNIRMIEPSFRRSPTKKFRSNNKINKPKVHRRNKSNKRIYKKSKNNFLSPFSGRRNFGPNRTKSPVPGYMKLSADNLKYSKKSQIRYFRDISNVKRINAGYLLPKGNRYSSMRGYMNVPPIDNHNQNIEINQSTGIKENDDSHSKLKSGLSSGSHLYSQKDDNIQEDISQPLPHQVPLKSSRDGMAESHLSLFNKLKYGINGEPLDVWIPVK